MELCTLAHTLNCGIKFTFWRRKKMKLLSYPVFPYFWHSTDFLEGSQASPGYPLVTTSCRGRWLKSVGGMTLTGKTAVLSENPVPVPHFPPQISHGSFWKNCGGQRGKIQSVPRSKHTSSRLYKPVSQCCIGK